MKNLILLLVATLTLAGCERIKGTIAGEQQVLDVDPAQALTISVADCVDTTMHFMEISASAMRALRIRQDIFDVYHQDCGDDQAAETIFIDHLSRYLKSSGAVGVNFCLIEVVDALNAVLDGGDDITVGLRFTFSSVIKDCNIENPDRQN